MTIEIKTLDDAHALIQEAMKDVIQELIIVDGEESHLVYIYKINLVKGKLNVEYSTPSEKDIKDLVHKAIRAQLDNYKEPDSWFTRLLRFLRLKK